MSQSSSTRPILVMIFAVPAIALALVMFFKDRYLLGIGFGAMILFVLAWMFVISIRDTTHKEIRYSSPYDLINDVQITQLPQQDSYRLDAKGRAFIVAKGKRSGTWAAREINPQTGNFISSQFTGSHRDPRGSDHSLAEYISYKINTGS